MSKKKPRLEKDNSERYLLTYGDLMNLLLIFFIILYSMSQVDSQKFQQLSSSFSRAFGGINASSGTSVITGGAGGDSIMNLNPGDLATSTPETTPNTNTGMGNGTAEEVGEKKVKEQVEKLINEQQLQGDLKVDLEERGVVISITASLLFQSGNANIESGSLPVLDKIGDILLTVKGNHIRVEGHTDTDPIKTSLYPSNWELSAARATNVLRRLVDNSNIDPHIISSVGYGEFRPRVPNTSEENKAKNRRVDIVIIKSAYDVSEAGQAK